MRAGLDPRCSSRAQILRCLAVLTLQFAAHSFLFNFHHRGEEKSVTPLYEGGKWDLEREITCLKFLSPDVTDLRLEFRPSSFPSFHTPRAEPDRGIPKEKG